SGGSHALDFSALAAEAERLRGASDADTPAIASAAALPLSEDDQEPAAGFDEVPDDALTGQESIAESAAEAEPELAIEELTVDGAQAADEDWPPPGIIPPAFDFNALPSLELHATEHSSLPGEALDYSASPAESGAPDLSDFALEEISPDAAEEQDTLSVSDSADESHADDAAPTENLEEPAGDAQPAPAIPATVRIGDTELSRQ